MFRFSHMLMAVMQKTLDEMPQAVIRRCSGKRITGVPMGFEISELCREQLNTLIIGDDFGFLCWKPQCAAGHLLLWSFAQQPWAWRQNRTWCICAYIYTHIHIYGPSVWHHGANQEKKDQRDKEGEDLMEHLQLLRLCVPQHSDPAMPCSVVMLKSEPQLRSQITAKEKLPFK